ncbi:MAG TPA: response regulator [Mariprofundaceae bacterium]|nr:response regulator [Mariprofundaceae bacterium]
MFHIVDDIPELRDILQSLMKHRGYDSMVFDSTESYLAYFHSLEFAAPIAIITDYVMTGENGFELIKAVREKLPMQKAVIVSATPSSELEANIESALCYSLSKPYRAEKLYALLAALVSCHHECGTNKDGFEAECKFGLEHECPFFPHKLAA